jgi:putative transposase
MARQRYSTDLTDKQWQKLQAVWPKAKNGRTGRPRKYPLREVLNTIFYQLRTGCAWRLLPHDLVPWTVAWEHFCRWRNDGTWQIVHNALYEQVRQKEARHRAPSAAALDSQAIKTTEKGGQEAISVARR